MKPICVKCRRFYRPKRNGLYFLEGLPLADGARPGNADPASWGPYKLWCGDLWECPDCGHELISGVGQQPLAEHFHDGFAEKVREYAATIQVNDC